MTHDLMPVELAEIIATHRRMFGGMVMTLPAPEGAPAGEPQDAPEGALEAGKPAGKPADGQPDGDQLREGGMKALRAEREARQALESKVKDLEGAKATLDQLAKVFGQDGGKPDAAAAMAAQVADLIQWRTDREADDARDALAAKVAKEAEITDASDIALIKAQADETAMKSLAARLKVGTPGPGRMRPDPSQGHGGSSGRPGSGTVTAGRDLFRDRHHKTTS